MQSSTAPQGVPLQADPVKALSHCLASKSTGAAHGPIMRPQNLSSDEPASQSGDTSQTVTPKRLVYDDEHFYGYRCSDE